MKDNRTIYLIREYYITSTITLRTYEPTDYTIDDVTIQSNNVVKLKTGRQPHSFYLSFNKIGYEYNEDGLLPLFADVKEDRSYNYHAKKDPDNITYPNCQLMMKTKGGYKYFKNTINGDEYLIAMNSHTFNNVKSF